MDKITPYPNNPTVIYKNKSKIIWSKRSKLNFILASTCLGSLLAYLLYLRLTENSLSHAIELLGIFIISYSAGGATERIEEFEYMERVQ